MNEEIEKNRKRRLPTQADKKVCQRKNQKEKWR